MVLVQLVDQSVGKLYLMSVGFFHLSIWQEALECCLSLPAVHDRSGILSTVFLLLDQIEA
jgi:hypothetical protein